MPRLHHRRDTDALLELVNQQYIQQSPRYLITGTVLGALGFLVAVVPYIMRIMEHYCNGNEIPRSEIPGTVSELVSKWETVEARIFFGFQLTAANCILLSWYPFKMRSACCIPSAGGCRIDFCGFGSMSWATFRQFMPPMGLVLVACCPTVPMSLDLKGVRPADFVLIGVHCIAAMMMFVGFLLSEAHALSTPIIFTNMVPLRCRVPTLDQDSSEWRWRQGTWHVSACAFVVFLIVQVYLLCSEDTRRRWSVVSFLSEVIAGLAMLANHGVIWWFSPERHWTARGIVGNWDGALVQPIASTRTIEGHVSEMELAETTESGEKASQTEPPATQADGQEEQAV